MSLKKLTDHQRSIIMDTAVGHSDAARSLEMTRDQVRSLRRRANVALAENTSAATKWTHEMDSAVWTKTIKGAAAHLGLHEKTVSARKKLLREKGILNCCPHCGKNL
jgi:hypothetical protein